MSSNNRTARIAGLLYLGVVLTGIFSLMYVPSKLFIWNDAATTFDKIVAAESLFRLGMVSYLICYIFFLFLPLVLFKLLKPVNEMVAKLMVILALISVPIAFANIQNQFTVLSLISDGQYLQMFSKDQLQSQVLLYLNQYDNGNLVISIFSGLWLFPFGYLVFKSGILPRILGVLLMFGCFGYLINFFGHALLPDYSKVGIASYISLPASIGEIGICLWLLMMGAKEKSKIKDINYREIQ
jgi:hypothetical protein